MNATEILEFFQWCEENLKNFTIEDCDESKHFYIGYEMVGGWAGDSRNYFICEGSDVVAKALRMFDAANSEDAYERMLRLS